MTSNFIVMAWWKMINNKLIKTEAKNFVTLSLEMYISVSFAHLRTLQVKRDKQCCRPVMFIQQTFPFLAVYPSVAYRQKAWAPGPEALFVN